MDRDHENQAIATRAAGRRLRVYVSANTNELAEERRTARQAITRLRLTPVMFEAAVQSTARRELYQTYLPQSDIFIGIYWEQYGLAIPGESVSSLEEEYKLSGGLSRLIYVKSPASRREPELKDLLVSIKTDGLSYRYFSSAGELAGLIENDLSLLLAERFPASRMDIPPEQSEPGVLFARLPAENGRFIGREIQVEAIRRLLLHEENRLILLTGPGGAGKTRLAMHAAKAAQEQFPDGVLYIDLATVSDPALLLPAIARAAGQREAPGEQPAVRLKAFLRPRRSLLVLDNLDHLISAAPLILEILSDAPRVKALASSQAALHLSSELEFPVLPLSLPGLSHRTVEAIGESEAVRLFASRASSVLTSENAPLTADICRRLDGLPLAIELAAAQALHSPLAELLANLDNRMKLLSQEDQNLPPRQRTMRAAIEWSFDRLGAGEKTLFARMAVFHGGGTLEAMQAICGRDQRIDILESTGALVEQTILQRELDEEGRLRFEMPDTLREYALERLDESGEMAVLQERHARFYQAMASQILHSQAPYRLELLALEIENLRAVLKWSLATPGELDTGVSLASELLPFWSFEGRLSEGRYWFQRLLQANPDHNSPGYAGMLAGAGMVVGWLGELVTANRLLDESIPLLRGAHEPQRLAQALLNRAELALEAGRAENARPDLEEALAIFRDLNERFNSAVCLMRLGQAALAEHQVDDARHLLAESTAIARRIGDAWLLPAATNLQGDVARFQGDYTRAGGYYDESGELFHQISARGDLARVIHNQAYVALRRGEDRLAGSLFRQSLEMCQSLGIQRGTTECLAGLASVDAAQGRLMPAARLLGFAQAFIEQLGLDWQPADRREIDQTRAGLQETLGEALFSLEEAAGRKQKPEDVLAIYQ